MESRGGKGGEQPLNAPHKTLLFLTTPIDKLHNPKHKESDEHAHITKQLATNGHSHSYSCQLSQISFNLTKKGKYDM